VAGLGLDELDLEKITRMLEDAKTLVSSGFDYKAIAKRFKIGSKLAKLLYESALSHVRFKDKFTHPYLMYIESARLATHEVVADYHARRLKTDSIADLGCGVGIQLIHFAMHSKRAIGVEIDKTRAEIARTNARIAGVEPEVIVGDVFSDEVKKNLDVDIVFSDPARPASEKVRTLNSCKPDPRRIVMEYKSRYAFDLPPQISREKVDLPKPIEFEYISLNHRLNRLTAYLGDLAKYKVSAIALPSEERIVYDSTIDRRISQSKPEPGEIVYDVDPSIIKADLLPELSAKHGLSLFMSDGKRALVYGSKVESAFLQPFVFLGETDRLVDFLRKQGIGKVILRYSISPTAYYKEKQKIESKLSGNDTAYIFKSKRYILLKKI